MNSSVRVLGVEYRIIVGTKHTHHGLKVADGFCDMSTREIVIKKQRETPKPNELSDLKAYMRLCLRHEIVHAMLYESGLAHNTSESKCWAMNEEMVDWIARQHAKLHAAFEEAGAL